MHSLLRIWATRKLSLKGKITLINSLIISLFVYPITLIDTPAAILEEIDKTITRFLWSGKKPKIAKKVLQNRIANGGLKLPDIKIKAKAWGLSWLQRAIKNPDKTWVKIQDANINDIKFIDLLKCTHPSNNLMTRLSKFYQNIINNWSKIRSINFENATSVSSQMLWYNKHITINRKPFFWKKWYNKGIILIKDILNKEGNFANEIEMKDKYGINISFLELLQIRQAMPHDWKLLLLDNPCTEDPQLYLTLYKTFSKSLNEIKTVHCYWAYIEKSKILPACIKKWEETLDKPPDWRKTFELPFITFSETKYQSFQYKILHRVVECNHWLCQIKEKDSAKCNYCNENDTIEHFFITCPCTIIFWQSFADWFSRITQADYGLEFDSIIFGDQSEYIYKQILNYCTIIAKYFIYQNKLKGETHKINIYNYLQNLKNNLDIKHEYASRNNKLEAFELIYNIVYNEI